MDPRQELANKLLNILADIPRVQSQSGQELPPIPSDVFDQLVAIIRLILTWLGFIGSLTLDEYKAAIQKQQAAKTEDRP